VPFLRLRYGKSSRYCRSESKTIRIIKATISFRYRWSAVTDSSIEVLILNRRHSRFKLESFFYDSKIVNRFESVKNYRNAVKITCPICMFYFWFCFLMVTNIPDISSAHTYELKHSDATAVKYIVSIYNCYFLHRVTLWCSMAFLYNLWFNYFGFYCLHCSLLTVSKDSNIRNPNRTVSTGDMQIRLQGNNFHKTQIKFCICRRKRQNWN